MKFFQNDHLKQQIAQGFIVVSALGAVLALGTACAPVTNSVSKIPTPANRLRTNDEHAHSYVTHARTHLIATDAYGNELAAAETDAPKDTGAYAAMDLSRDEIQDLRKKGSTTIRIPNAGGGLEVHAVLKINVLPTTIEQKNLKSVELKWTSLNALAAEYAISLIDTDDAAGNKHKDVQRTLIGLSVLYREIK